MIYSPAEITDSPSLERVMAGVSLSKEFSNIPLTSPHSLSFVKRPIYDLYVISTLIFIDFVAPNYPMLVNSSHLAFVSGDPVGDSYRFKDVLTGDPIVDSYRPRTPLGIKLLEIRCAYIEGGGKLLDETGLEDEIRARRGGRDGKANLP